MKISPQNYVAPRPPRSLDSIVPGDYPQVEKDLEEFPAPILDALDRYGVRVAVLADGETLADSPALRHPTEAEYREERREANQLLHRALSDRNDVSLPDFAESITRELRKTGLEFHLGISRTPATARRIADREGISERDFPHWQACFQELNQGLPDGLYLLPHHYHQGKPIPENRLRSARETTAGFVERSLGLNRAEDRMVLLHERFIGAPAQEIGNYRLAIHEMGHALDHLLDRITGLPGFGTLHRQTVDALYQADQKRAEKQGVEEVFTTRRASENVREYFAEAVEAYLTVPLDNGHDGFRTANSRPELEKRNPKLYDYVERVLSSDLDQGTVPEPPRRPLLPPGFPNPDDAVILL